MTRETDHMSEAEFQAFAEREERKPGCRARSRPGYRHAISWMALNDDTEWVDDPEPSLSVTAALVADLFGRTDAEVLASLRREIRRHGRGASHR
jgi:hypothetical protein